jgi:pyruvate dehydrogenase E2 component (dihydrolipoamide acetyltransferase)
VSTLQALTVPKWGMSMEEGEVQEWRVALGDVLAPGDEIVDIETSKIVNTAESTAAGTLVRIVGQPGQTLQVGMLLGVVASGDTTEPDIDAFVATFAAKPVAASAENASPPVATAAVPQTQPTSGEVSSADLAAGADDSEVKASVVARRIALAHNVNLNNVQATGRNGRVSKRDVEQAAGIRILATMAATTGAPKAAGGDKHALVQSNADDSHIASTPVARRIARQLNINLNDVTATGVRGRVCKEDVERAAIALSGGVAYREVPLTGMRKTIAARLTESKQTIPHYRVSVDIEIDSLLQQRKFMNTELGVELSINDFIVKASASALERVPEVNVQYTGTSLRMFEQVDIAMAVAIEGGLITPVIRNVARKGLPAIAAESRELARRAQLGKLSLDEFEGGTFSISNLGMYGVDEFDAVINLPQAAILAVAAGRRKPVVRGDNLVPATVMRVTLSSDHRAIDGAVAARFLQVLKGFLENPASMLL